MRPPRLTTRRLMLAVAVVGAVLGPASWLHRRSALMMTRVRLHERASFQSLIWGPGSIQSETPQSRYHSELAVKYHEAARRPWLLVEPDPPEPK